MSQIESKTTSVLPVVTPENEKWLEENFQYVPNNPRSVQNMKELGRQVYTAIYDNGFENIDIRDFLDRGAPLCQNSEYASLDFTADRPDEEEYREDGRMDEYDADFQAWFDETQSKQMICAACPIQKACLAASFRITPQKNGTFRFKTESVGINGGCAVGMRQEIADEVLRLWDNDETAPYTVQQRTAFRTRQMRQEMEMFRLQETQRRTEADERYNEIADRLDCQ